MHLISERERSELVTTSAWFLFIVSGDGKKIIFGPVQRSFNLLGEDVIENTSLLGARSP